MSEHHEITDDQLRDLFARHCECRPIDLARGEDDHAANHDCDTEILRDVQVVLDVVVLFDDVGRIPAMREARSRCAEALLRKRNARGGWGAPGNEAS